MLTKRGAIAKAYYEKLCTIPASQVKIGDKILTSGMTHGGSMFNAIGTVTAILSRQAKRTTVKTLRADGVLDVSYRTEYAETEGFSVLGSSGATIERTGEAGTFIEEFTEYLFTTVSKYGESRQTVTDSIRAYGDANAANLALALAYQETLTKTGSVRKVSKKQAVSKSSTDNLGQ